jgi:lipopolysaccharide export system permease protein
MSLLSRYVVRELLGVFVPTLLCFVLLYLVVDFFDRLDILLRHDASAASAIRYFVFKIPLMVTQVLPPAVLLATLVALGMLGRRNEITVMRAAGVSLMQTARPLLIAAAVISCLAFAWDELVVPYCSRQFQYVNNIEIRKRAQRSLFRDREIWYRGSRGIYNIDHVDQSRGMLFGLTIYDITGSFDLSTIVEVPTATWKGNGWEAHGAVKHWITESGDLETTPLAADDIVIGESLDDFREVRREAEELSYAELRSRVENLTSQGIDASEYLVDLQMKLAVPLASFVLACVGIPLAGRVRRQTSVAALVGMGLCAGAGYWVILAFTKSLGDTGVIGPVPATWTANAVYLAIGGSLFLGRE